MELRMRRLFALVIVLLLAVAPCALAPAQTDEPAQTPQAGDEWTEPITGMVFVWVPGGCYEMGCGEWAGDYCNEEKYPPHEVCVDGFWMGKYEVTQGQWNLVMPKNPSFFSINDTYPVEQVTWPETQAFIVKLELLVENRLGFRLPNEAEWEFACRSGGLNEIYSGGYDVDRVAWYNTTEFGEGTNPVGEKQPNALGLFDMSGNTAERVVFWQADDPYISHVNDNPMYTIYGIYRITRGGSWGSSHSGVQCFCRNVTRRNYTSNRIGFRLIIENQ